MKEGGWVVRFLTPIQNPRTGEMDRVSVISKGITDRKKMEKRKQLFASSVDRASLEIYWINPQGKFEYANDTAEERLGYSKEELKDMYVWEIDSEYEEEDWKEQWEELKQEEFLNFESIHKTKDGETFPVEITSHHLEHREEEYEFAFAKDISELKKAKNRLEESERRLKELHDVAVELGGAESKEEICRIAVDAAEEVLDFTICSIDLVDGNGNLKMEGTSAGIIPSDYFEIYLGDGCGRGNALLLGESYVIEDLKKERVADSTEEEYRSAISVPIGDKGVFQAVSTEKGHFDEGDLEIAELLVSHISETLGRIRSGEND